jgi:hypothetical protein
LAEFFNTIVEMASDLALAIGVNRDLFCSEIEAAFYREMKQDLFTHVFELNRNLAGYSRDVHGQLNVITQTKQAIPSTMVFSESSVKNIKWKLTENKVELFEHFVI